MNKITSKRAKSNKLKAIVFTLFMHGLLVGGIVWGTGVATASSSGISQTQSKAIAGTKSSTIKSKYYKAAQALKNRNK